MHTLQRTPCHSLLPRPLPLAQGVYRWFTSGQEMEGEYDTSNVGRTPNVVDSQ